MTYCAHANQRELESIRQAVFFSGGRPDVCAASLCAERFDSRKGNAQRGLCATEQDSVMPLTPMEERRARCVGAQLNELTAWKPPRNQDCADQEYDQPENQLDFRWNNEHCGESHY